MGQILPTHTRTYRLLVAETTINATTLLSTDYLNHFNEFVMMLELVADMPDMADALEEWRPLTYREHFEASGFTHKALAIAAYEHAPDPFRLPFEATVATIDRLVEEANARVVSLAGHQDIDESRHHLLEMSRQLRAMIERAGAIINGASIESLETADGDNETIMGQQHIDALFA